MSWRRIALAAVAGTLSGACSSSSNAPPPPSDAGLTSMTFAHPSVRDLDVLFVIDDAPGMAPAQERLRASFAAFTETLRTLPAGYPDLHVAIISSDLGAGAEDVPGCRPGGDRGVFWSAPRGACKSVGLPRGQTFFSIVDGTSNFDPGLGLADALACVTVKDDAGCRFPQPFAAALRALGADGQPAPPENAGFLRTGAFLAIVLVTNQDDCSVPADSKIFDPASRYVADPLGPLTTFRCAELGLSCGGRAPSRAMAGSVAGCASAEDGTLVRVSEAVSRLKALVGPNQVLVAALSGPPDPFAVELDAPGLTEDPQRWPALTPSCTSADGVVSARPGVRVEQWVYAFGHNGVLTTACDDFAASLQTIATSFAAVLGPPCLTGPIAQTVGPNGPRPDCTIFDYGAASGDGGGPAPIFSCVDTGGEGPCWTLTDDPVCPHGELLQFTPFGRKSAQAIALDTSVECVVCTDPSDPRCR
jgi:hypothetical protein